MAKAATAVKPTPKGAATKIEDILDRPSNEAMPPPTWPAGSYRTTVKGLPRFDKSTQKKTPYVEFMLQATAALDDVDETELAEFGDLATKPPIKATFYLTDASEYRLKEFLNACGVAEVDDNDEPLSHRQRIEETPNCEVIVTMIHEPSPDGQRMFAKPGAFALAE